MKKTLFSTFLIVLVAFTLLVAQSAAKKREFTGDITVQICAKTAAGQWQIVDELKVPSAKFVASVSDLAGKKGVASDFAFTGKTSKGRSVSARLKPNATGDVDLATGFLALDLPFAITIDGKQADSALKLTTDSAQGATGNISGRRAKINSAARTANLKLVGSTTLKSPIALSAGPAGGLTSDQAADRKAEKAQERAEQLGAAGQDALLVITGDGTLKAID